MTEIERKIEVVKQIIEEYAPPAPIWTKIVVKILIRLPDSDISQRIVNRMRNNSMKEFLFILDKKDMLRSYLTLIEEIEEAQKKE